MAGAIGEGYATTSSDAGVPASAYTPDEWAQVSAGNPNLYLLQGFASVALNDQQVHCQRLYGEPLSFSYWSGCSRGGRQGMMLAKRYPEAYGGIAAAPVLNLPQFFTAAAWAHVVMNLMDISPFPCELNAIIDVAIAACDPLDGIIDGLVSDASACKFDPFSMVGQQINCTTTGALVRISEGAATVANLTWTGPRSSTGESLWYGLDSPARLTGVSQAAGTTSDFGYAMSSCTNDTCVGVPTSPGESWLKCWVQKNPRWDYTAISSVEEYTNLIRASVQQYDSIIGTADADLRKFQAAIGKMITYRGLMSVLPWPN
ncbi:putative feruloyl esterase [Paramyrothecium foliicola]|nr:putative feruloyl esterase [Paramyrothecium foliicola]